MKENLWTLVFSFLTLFWGWLLLDQLIMLFSHITDYDHNKGLVIASAFISVFSAFAYTLFLYVSGHYIAAGHDQPLHSLLKWQVVTVRAIFKESNVESNGVINYTYHLLVETKPGKIHYIGCEPCGLVEDANFKVNYHYRYNGTELEPLAFGSS